jgi:hypothetical protein
MPLDPGADSRFKQSTPILTSNGDETFGIMKKPSFLNRENLSSDQINNLTIDADLAGRPDLISQELYGRPTLDWVVTMFNRVENPFNWPLIGQVIQYPVPEVVFAEL